MPLACNPCANRSRRPISEVKKADFYTEYQNIIVPMCADHAFEIAKAGGDISPLPGTENQGVSAP